ncbi:hypothetical protein N7478_012051 [Penicillium angulare]|uniref:uncharacterized protein n=1 Tax=Penicillium angulare TaxID=116970 RepID=UPI0025409EAD|nr:uncharacterized protein N7478_012051 [Penicillium angulare]KAJ5261456.1 hypothetical protein N7478_012051 [Penicillium angulare]
MLVLIAKSSHSDPLGLVPDSGKADMEACSYRRRNQYYIGLLFELRLVEPCTECEDNSRANDEPRIGGGSNAKIEKATQ